MVGSFEGVLVTSSILCSNDRDYVETHVYAQQKGGNTVYHSVDNLSVEAAV